MQNPEEVLAYFSRLGNELKRGRDVAIDLREADCLTVDAIVLLLAFAANRNFRHGRNVDGTLPIRKDLKKFLLESGFFEHVEPGGRPRGSRGRSMNAKLDRGIIRTQTEKRVATDLAKEATAYGTRLAFGTSRRYPPVYKTIIECMANTHNHAHPVALGDTHWWLAVGRIPNSNRVAYAFVDLGVGILRGRRFQFILRIYDTIAAVLARDQRVEVFSDILAGKVASRTGHPYRGKGLPAIFECYQKQEIKRLVVCANEIFADFDSSGPRLLPSRRTFPGTFLYWEI